MILIRIRDIVFSTRTGWIKITSDKEGVERDVDKKGSKGSVSLLSHSI